LQLPNIIQERRFGTEIAALTVAALCMFVFTIVVGILNGTDAVDFDQRTILTHVHMGTLGWLTLSVFAASLWLFGEGELSRGQEMHARATSYAAIAVFLVYNYAFLTTYGEFRPTVGGFAGLVIAGFLAWVLMRAPKVEMTTPHVGILVAVATSVIGAVLGVLLGMRLATGDNWVPEGGEDAHPATMVVGFLIPVAMALGEWALTWPRPAPVTRLGIAQMALPFIGGIMLMVGLLWEIDPLVQLSLPLELLGIGIFIYRMRSQLRGALTPGAEWSSRFAAISPPYLFVVIALFIYLIGKHDGDADLIPDHQVIAIDHLTFIGAMTNAIFALLFSMLAARFSRLPIVPALVFITVNIGLVLFVLGLYNDTTTLKRIGTPALGTALLVAIGFFLWAILVPEREPEGQEPEETRAVTP
jgi:hypothetical protein